MSKKKLIVFSVVPLTKKIYQSWYIGDLLKLFRKDFEFWDISKLHNHNNKDPNKVKGPYVKKFKNIKELKKNIKKNENVKKIILSIVNLNFDTYKILNNFNNKNTYLILILWGFMPQDYLKLLKKISLKMTFDLSIKRIFEKIFLKTGIVSSKIFNLVFVAGKKSIERAKKLSDNLFETHLIDYDNYLEFKKNKKKNYCVFLDQAYTCHSDDLQLDKKKIHMDYYKSLDIFFSKIEKKFKLKVKIALHPKNYLPQKYFFGRSTYLGSTAKLVRESKFVFAHTSLSISYAILNLKPLIFLNSKIFNDYSDNGEDVRIAKILSNYLGCEFLNIDKFKPKNSLKLKVNKTLYNKYKYNYIVSKNKEGISSRDIFINKIKKIKLL